MRRAVIKNKWEPMSFAQIYSIPLPPSTPAREGRQKRYARLAQERYLLSTEWQNWHLVISILLFLSIFWPVYRLALCMVEDAYYISIHLQMPIPDNAHRKCVSFSEILSLLPFISQQLEFFLMSKTNALVLKNETIEIRLKPMGQMIH